MWKIIEGKHGSSFDVYREDGTHAATCITMDDVYAYLNWQEETEGVRSDYVISFRPVNALV